MQGLRGIYELSPFDFEIRSYWSAPPAYLIRQITGLLLHPHAAHQTQIREHPIAAWTRKALTQPRRTRWLLYTAHESHHFLCSQPRRHLRVTSGGNRYMRGTLPFCGARVRESAHLNSPFYSMQHSPASRNKDVVQSKSALLPS